MDVGKISIADVLKMSPAERILFVEDVWDSLAANPDSVLLPDSHREELDRRLEAYHPEPDAGSPWAEVRDRIRQAS